MIDGTQPHACVADFSYLSELIKPYIVGLEVLAISAYDARWHGRKRGLESNHVVVAEV